MVARETRGRRGDVVGMVMMVTMAFQENLARTVMADQVSWIVSTHQEPSEP